METADLGRALEAGRLPGVRSQKEVCAAHLLREALRVDGVERERDFHIS